MANLTETFDLPLSCQEERASSTLFKNISNGKEIKDQVMKGNIDAALIKPTMVNFNLFSSAYYRYSHALDQCSKRYDH